MNRTESLTIHQQGDDHGAHNTDLPQASSRANSDMMGTCLDDLAESNHATSPVSCRDREPGFHR
jgi:hypothetical protein